MRAVGFFKSRTDWAELAQNLGLSPRVANAGYGQAASFGQLTRAIGAHAPPPPRFSHWLTGMWRGTESIVVHYATGSGKSRHLWTSAVVRLDPPLLLGATIDRDGSLARLFDGEDVALGIPHLDAALRLSAFSPDRLRELLYPRDHHDYAFLGTMAAEVHRGLSAADSRVTVRLPHLVVEPNRIRAALEVAHFVAAGLRVRRARMQPTPVEVAIRGAWAQFADRHGFTFDPERMLVRGTAGGATIEIALETVHRTVGTSIHIGWPRSLRVGLHVKKQGSLAFLTNLFEQDFKTGDGAFDEAFIVQGHDAAWVRHALAAPALREALRVAAHVATELTMNDEGLSWMHRLPARSTVELEEHLALATRASTALFGKLEDVGPYR